MGGVEPLVQHTMLDQGNQPLGEHLAAQAEPGLELIESMDAAGHIPDHEQCPPVPNDTQRLRDGAVRVGKVGVSHTPA